MVSKKILKQYMQLSYEERVSLARTNYATFGPVLKKFFGDQTSADMMTVNIGFCLGLDSGLTTQAIQFIIDVLHSDFNEELLVMASNTPPDDDFVELVHNLVKIMDYKAKYALYSFFLCVLTIDENLSAGELAFIEKLMP